MSDCLDADAILAIGDALEWNVDEGLAHLRTCADCRAQLETLRRTRERLLASTPVDAETLQRISVALHGARHAERDQARRRSRLRQAAEAGAAGVTALLVLFLNDIPIEGPGSVAVAFSLGAMLMTLGSAIARRLPAFQTRLEG